MDATAFQRSPSRLQRIRSMSAGQIAAKVRGKLVDRLSPSRNFLRLADALHRRALAPYDGPYCERSEYGPSNLEMKLMRQASGGPFEPYNVTLVNRVAAALLEAGDARVLEVGSGTGMFAAAAAADGQRMVTASEFDDATRRWAETNRARPNIRYCRMALDECATDAFDLVVALEVIEHLADYAGFLKQLSSVAPRAIVSTPNRLRSAEATVAATPAFDQHVREWSAGEFYWVLRAFYGSVTMYTLPDETRQVARLQRDPHYQPVYRPMGINGREWQMIAVCSQPSRFWR